MRGLGATTGVASLLIFSGAAAASFSFGFCFCSAGLGTAGCGGGGGGTSVTSKTRITLCGSPRSTRPEMCRKTNRSAA